MEELRGRSIDETRRADLLGGEIESEAGPDGGTLVVCTVPLLPGA